MPLLQSWSSHACEGSSVRTPPGPSPPWTSSAVAWAGGEIWEAWSAHCSTQLCPSSSWEQHLQGAGALCRSPKGPALGPHAGGGLIHRGGQYYEALLQLYLAYQQ